MENMLLNMPATQFKELVRQSVHDILLEDADFLQALLKPRPKKMSQVKKSDVAVNSGYRRNIKPHPLLGKIKIKYDPIEPLSADDWPEEAD